MLELALMALIGTTAAVALSAIFDDDDDEVSDDGGETDAIDPLTVSAEAHSYIGGISDWVSGQILVKQDEVAAWLLLNQRRQS